MNQLSSRMGIHPSQGQQKASCTEPDSQIPNDEMLAKRTCCYHVPGPGRRLLGPAPQRPGRRIDYRERAQAPGPQGHKLLAAMSTSMGIFGTFFHQKRPKQTSREGETWPGMAHNGPDSQCQRNRLVVSLGLAESSKFILGDF